MQTLFKNIEKFWDRSGRLLGGILKIPKVPALLYVANLWHPLVELSKDWDLGVDVGEYWPGADSLDALAREEMGIGKPQRERSKVKTKKKFKQKELEDPEGPR